MSVLGIATTGILELPDIRQPDNFSCGACAAMSVGRYFEVGPETLEEWKDALGTTIEKSTSPQAIASYLSSLGLSVKSQHGMSYDDLAAFVESGCPVICPVQDYAGQREEKALWDYGHWLAVCGVIRPGYVIAQDSSIENAEHKLGGGVDPKDADEDTNIEAPGKILVRRQDWEENWHDEDEHGLPFVQFGIVVGPPPEAARSATADVERTIYTTSGPGKHEAEDVTPAGFLAMSYEYIHQARVNLPPYYDELSGPQEIESGIRVQWAKVSGHDDKQPILYQFDATKFSEAQANSWLDSHNVQNYVFQPDTRDKIPQTQGHEAGSSEKAPNGFIDLKGFYAATVPVEV